MFYFGPDGRENFVQYPIVDKALPGSGVQVVPSVIFLSPKTTLEVIDPVMPVAYAYPKKKPTIKDIIRDDKKKDNVNLLSDQQMATLDDAFMALVGASKSDPQLASDEG